MTSKYESMTNEQLVALLARLEAERKKIALILSKRVHGSNA